MTAAKIRSTKARIVRLQDQANDNLRAVANYQAMGEGNTGAARGAQARADIAKAEAASLAATLA